MRTTISLIIAAALLSACASQPQHPTRRPAPTTGATVQREIERAQQRAVRDVFNQGNRVFRDAIRGR